MKLNESLVMFLESFVHTGIYCIDRNSMEVVYENATARNYSEKERIGKPCYESHGNTSICFSCPLRKPDRTSFVIREDYGMIFTLKALETVFDDRPVYCIFVSKYKDLDIKMGEHRAQFSRMNRAMQSTLLSYCEVNMSSMKCTSIPFFKANMEEMKEHDYAGYFEEICRLYIHPDDISRLKKVLHPDILQMHSRNSSGPSEISIRYRSSLQTTISSVYESKVYYLRNELPHYCCIVTTEVTREESEKMQLMLYNEITKNAATTFQLNLTRNWCSNVTSARPTNPSAMKYLLACKTVDEYCSTSLRYVMNIPGMESALTFFNRENMIKSFQEGTHTLSCLFPYIVENGSYEWMSVGLNMIENPLSGDIEAIAYSENVNEQLLQKTLISQMIKNDFDYLIIINLQKDTSRTFTGNNQSCWHPNASASISNYIRETYVGDDMEDFIAKNQLDYVCSQLEAKEKYEVYYCHRDKNGKICYKKGTYSYPHGDHRYLLFSRTDNTFVIEEQKRINKELQQALAAKEKAYHDRADFFARMSHDMRTPMNGILGIARLQDRKDADSLRYDMERILQSGEYMLSLINDSLDLQRVESGKMEINLQPVKIRSFIDSVADMIQAAAAEKGICFKMVNRNMDLNLYMMVDPIRLKQIYVNLLNNAVKFTPPGGVVSWIFESAPRHGNQMEYTSLIQDTGIGMSPEFLENKLFQPFAQEPNPMFSQYAGSGLGLAIVKNLISLIGGTIEAESEPGRGTCFTLHLPVTVITPDKIGQNSQNESDEYMNTELLSGKTVLLCEDHPLNAEITIRLMNTVGCEVVWAKDGMEGVKLFEQFSDFHFDAILMDIRMPVLDGIEATKIIRASKHLDAKTIPIIAMTANAFEEDARRSLTAGMNAHLSKPVSPQLLYDTLIRHLAQ